MLKANYILSIFEKSVKDWHEKIETHYEKNSMEEILYSKNQIDTIQWHVEDEIRRPDLPDSDLVKFKREIDSLNQKRTDLVEKLDDFFYNQFLEVKKETNAKMNSETPAWLIDRMSILELKIFHMEEQVNRKDASSTHIETCQKKLKILLEQKNDLSFCLDDLLKELSQGKKFMKVYRQMKMYNDQNLNPSLYQNQK